MKNPCVKDCPGRSQDCHGRCEKYREWKAFNDKRRESGREGVEANIFRKIRREMRERRGRGGRK